MMEEDFYAYEQRAERLRDYNPDLSEASALMQARFGAHGSGVSRNAATADEPLANPAIPSPHKSSSKKPHQTL